MSIIRVMMLFAGVVAIGAAAVAGYVWHQGQTPPAAQPILVLASPAPQPDFSALLIADNEGKRQVLACTKLRCTKQPLPDATVDQAVFDGEGWLYYTEAESALSKLTKRILVRTLKATGVTQQIIEQTPLTSPRELYASPTGEHAAFFLDNIGRPQDELTELWVYDRAKHGVRLVAEKLYRPDIRSRVRWNRAGTLLWFLADNGTQESNQDVLELVVAPLSAPPAVSFKRISWGKLAEIVDEGAMDISPSGATLAYAAPRLFGRNEIMIGNSGQEQHSFSVRGDVVYLQVLEDDSLLYGVQDGGGVTFWRSSGNVQRHIARQAGRLLSAQGIPSGEFVAVAMQPEGKSLAQLQLLHTPTGTLTPPAAGIAQGSVHVTQLLINPAAPPATGDGSAFDDAEIAAFIDQNFPAIIDAPNARPRRLLITDRANTVFIDYTSRAGKEERILVAVEDLVHVDWAIVARYTIEQAEWRKVQGGGLPDPKPVRLYEWEESVEQWILKSSFEG